MSSVSLFYVGMNFSCKPNRNDFFFVDELENNAFNKNTLHSVVAICIFPQKERQEIYLTVVPQQLKKTTTKY